LAFRAPLVRRPTAAAERGAMLCCDCFNLRVGMVEVRMCIR